MRLLVLEARSHLPNGRRRDLVRVLVLVFEAEAWSLKRDRFEVGG